MAHVTRQQEARPDRDRPGILNLARLSRNGPASPSSRCSLQCVCLSIVCRGANQCVHVFFFTAAFNAQLFACLSFFSRELSFLGKPGGNFNACMSVRSSILEQSASIAKKKGPQHTAAGNKERSASCCYARSLSLPIPHHAFPATLTHPTQGREEAQGRGRKTRRRSNPPTR